jgi:acyl homoserine lactone synthase
MHYIIAPKESFSKETLYAMHRLRANVFKHRKGWDIPLIGEMEIDGYDALDPYYMLIQDSESDSLVQGCWRLLPTTGPYMLKDTFGQLLNGHPLPSSEDIWELSRFAINARHPQAMSFSQTSLEAIREIILYGVRQALHSYVTVTTVGVERMLTSAGINTRRFGPPQTIGVERAVALEIMLCEKTLNAVSN